MAVVDGRSVVHLSTFFTLPVVWACGAWECGIHARWPPREAPARADTQQDAAMQQTRSTPCAHHSPWIRRDSSHCSTRSSAGSTKSRPPHRSRSPASTATCTPWSSPPARGRKIAQTAANPRISRNPRARRTARSPSPRRRARARAATARCAAPPPHRSHAISTGVPARSTTRCSTRSSSNSRPARSAPHAGPRSCASRRWASTPRSWNARGSS